MFWTGGTEVGKHGEQLRKNRELAHCLSGMQKTYTIQSLLGGRMRWELSANASGAQPDPRGARRKPTKLRSATNRFEHMKTQPAVFLRPLRNILPEHYPGARAQR